MNSVYIQTLLHGKEMTRLIFKQSKIGLNPEFFFFLTSCLTKAKEHSLSYYSPIAKGEILDSCLSQGH